MKTILFCTAAIGCVAVLSGRTAEETYQAVMARTADRISVDKGWRFRLDGGKWRTVDLPHDWSIGFMPSLENGTDQYNAFLPGGVGEYCKDITVEEPMTILFEGAFRDARLFVDDELRATDFYGYLPFSASLKKGVNHVRVVVDNSAQPNSGNYTGSGINRRVWLVKPDATPARPASRMPKVEWSVKNGLVIDGKPVKLHGGCVHADNGPLGTACWEEAEVRKVRQLKAAGFNAIRQGHHAFSEAFLDACDAEGMWVLADYFDVWSDAKQTHDYSTCFAENWEKDLRAIIRRDFRHPSIVIWSIGNEVTLHTGAKKDPEILRRNVAQARAMAKVVREEDPYGRPVLIANCGYEGQDVWQYLDPLAAEVDIVGYNYQEPQTEIDHARHPERVIAYTETFAKDPAYTWRMVRSHPYVVGEFVWSAMDYIGEATVGRWYYEGLEPPGEHWEAEPYYPWHGSTPGDIDQTGWRKPHSHYREILWHEDAPTYIATREPDGWRGVIKTTGWSVWPTWESWNYEGWEGKPITVEVYSRKPHLVLTLNGRVVGESDNGEGNAYLCSFTVPYEPGVLACDGAALRTAGPVARIRFSEEKIGRLTWITAEAVDKDGIVNPNAAVDVVFPGDIIGTCSADMKDLVPMPSRCRRTWHGRAIGVVRNKN